MTVTQAPAFPFDGYLSKLVQLLETAEYGNPNEDREALVQNLHYVYSESVKHFTQPLQQTTLHLKPDYTQVLLETCSTFAVYCYPDCSPQLQTSIGIFTAYAVFLDDRSKDDPLQEMASVCEDLLDGGHQNHPWWRLMSDFLPQVLKHYGSLSSLTIIRSTMDFFQGCMIEHYDFEGFRGSHDYPFFLRRLTGVAQGYGAMLFPKDQFDEHALFNEIISSIAQSEPLILFLNDLFSFYKEFGCPKDETGLINGYCHVDGISVYQSFNRVADDSIVRFQQILDVFEHKDPKIRAAIRRFFQGYITWHLTCERYRLNELYELCGDRPNEVNFRHYYEEAIKAKGVETKEWAVPSVATVIEEQAYRS